MHVQQNVLQASHIAEKWPIYIIHTLKVIMFEHLAWQANKYLRQLIRTQALHLNYLIVASSVVKRIAPLREVVHNVAWIEDGNPGAVVPRQAQGILYKKRTRGDVECQMSKAIRYYID